MKQQLLDLTAGNLRSLTDAQREVKKYKGTQVFSKTVLSTVSQAATQWFDQVTPELRKAGFPTPLLEENSRRFEHLLKQSKINPQKAGLLKNISEAIERYRSEIAHNIEINAFTTASGLSIAPYIEGLDSVEAEYLEEAQRCLTAEALRGCIVLGWCAVIARIHAKIGELGYDKFSAATVSMFERATGRYRFFKKKYDVTSISELQRVFDTDLLLILEFMELIDGNQHERLRYCFEFRNNSAHPGLAPIKPANLYSFYSDISEFVLKNPKFALNAG